MNPALRNIILAPQGIVKRGLVAWYDFTDPAGSQVLTDKSGYENHGQNGSTAGADTNDVTFDGVKGTFGGDDYISLPADIRNLISAFSNYTIEILFNGTTTALFSSTISASNRMAIEIIEGSLRASHYNGASHLCARSGALNTSITNYLSYVFSADNNGRLLLNGNELTGTTDATTRVNVNCFIGTRTDGKASFNGSIYYVMIYNRRLTVVEQKRNYRSIRKIATQRGIAI